MSELFREITSIIAPVNWTRFGNAGFWFLIFGGKWQQIEICGVFLMSSEVIYSFIEVGKNHTIVIQALINKT